MAHDEMPLDSIHIQKDAEPPTSFRFIASNFAAIVKRRLNKQHLIFIIGCQSAQENDFPTSYTIPQKRKTNSFFFWRGLASAEIQQILSLYL